MPEPNRQVDLQCPQCGAPVSMEEDDRILDCAYCRVRLVLLYPGFPRYYLEPYQGAPLKEPTYYLPYWRVRGMTLPGFSSHKEEKVVDVTCEAVKLSFLPPDLGLQARAFRLCLLSSQKKGKFFKPELGPEIIENRLVGGKGCFLGPDPEHNLINHGFFAPSIGLVYVPVIFTDGQAIDGLGNRPWGSLEGFEPNQYEMEEQDPSWLVKFKPALCPYCGADLLGSKETLVFLCPNCDRAWESDENGLKGTPFRFIENDRNRPSYWLPFWKIASEITGPEEGSENQKKGYFWLPAFKIAPALFLTISRAINHRSPEALPVSEKVQPGDHYPVTVSGSQAIKGLSALSPSLISPFSLISLEDPLLVYIPFQLQGNEWVQEEISLGINKNALNFGRWI